MLTPCCPNAGPTGGAGVACPPGHWSLTFAVITLAIARPLRRGRRTDAPRPPGGTRELALRRHPLGHRPPSPEGTEDGGPGTGPGIPPRFARPSALDPRSF